MLLGTAPWLVVAGLVEGFITPAGFALPIVITIGLGLGSLYWGLVFWRGRPEAVTETVTEAAAMSFAVAGT
jgi:hypothetical protein